MLIYAGIRVTDLERSVRFYTRRLRLRVERRGVMDHGGQYVQLVDRQSKQRLELNWYPPSSPFRTPFEPGEALDHLGFKVPDARRAYARLRARGASSAIPPREDQSPYERPRRHLYEIAYVKDPDGNWIELFSGKPLRRVRRRRSSRTLSRGRRPSSRKSASGA